MTSSFQARGLRGANLAPVCAAPGPVCGRKGDDSGKAHGPIASPERVNDALACAGLHPAARIALADPPGGAVPEAAPGGDLFAGAGQESTNTRKPRSRAADWRAAVWRPLAQRERPLKQSGQRPGGSGRCIRCRRAVVFSGSSFRRGIVPCAGNDRYAPGIRIVWRFASGRSGQGQFAQVRSRRACTCRWQVDKAARLESARHCGCAAREGLSRYGAAAVPRPGRVALAKNASRSALLRLLDGRKMLLGL